MLGNVNDKSLNKLSISVCSAALIANNNYSSNDIFTVKMG